MFSLNLEVLINNIFSGHLFPGSKEVFLMKIMFPALKASASIPISMILRIHRKSVKLLKQLGGFFPMDEKRAMTATDMGKHFNTS